jgi:probable HAF family extracellular repeat protein
VLVNSSQPGVLILNEPWSKDWHAKVSSQPVRVLRANFTQPAVVLPAGRSYIEFEYKPMFFSFADQRHAAFLWPVKIRLTDLVRLSNSGNVNDTSHGDGVNSSGHVTGFSTTATFSTNAILYLGGTMKDLNDLVAAGKMAAFIFLGGGSAINDSGQVSDIPIRSSVKSEDCRCQRL